MATELTVAIAQILTGAATLVVAVFLAGQLLIQRKVLDRAHEDAEVELSISSNSIFMGLWNMKLTCEPVRKAFLRKNEPLKDLPEEDVDALNQYFMTQYNFINVEWRLKRLDRSVTYFKARYSTILDCQVGFDFYRETGRGFVDNLSVGGGLKEIADSVFEQQSGQSLAA